MALKDVLRLAQLQPARIVVELADGSSRELKPAKDSRKRWIPIIEPMEQFDWIRAELFDRKDVTLAVVTNPAAAPADMGVPEPGQCCPTCGRPVGGDDLDRMLRAMTAAAQWQDKSVERAMNLNVATIENMNEAINGMVKAHQLQIDAVRAAPRAGGVAANDDGEDDILKRVIPLAARLLGDGSGPLEGLTPERLDKLTAFLDALPPPRPAAAPASKQASSSTPASKQNGNGAHS